MTPDVKHNVDWKLETVPEGTWRVFGLSVSHQRRCFKVNLYVWISVFVSALLFSLSGIFSLLSFTQINELDDWSKA